MKTQKHVPYYKFLKIQKIINNIVKWEESSIKSFMHQIIKAIKETREQDKLVKNLQC